MAKAATGLIIAHASWLAREDFARFIRVGASINDPGTKLASIDDRNVGLLVKAVIRASGRRQFPR